MGKIGCYSVDLYCDHSDCMIRFDCRRPITYIGPSKGSCYQQARANGWLINDSANIDALVGTGKCLCPKHSGKSQKEKR